MVFGFSVFGSSSGAKDEKHLLDTIQSLIDDHKGDEGDTDLDLFGQAAKDLRAALDVEIARGAKKPKILMRIELLSDGILSNLENRITAELLDTKDGPALADRCVNIAKDLDAVRATKASTILSARCEDLQEKGSSLELVKVKEAYAEIPKDPAKVFENVRNVMTEIEVCHAKASTSKKVCEKLVNYCVQLASVLLKGLIQALQADPSNAIIAKQLAESMDGIAEKLVVVLGSKWDPPAKPQVEDKVNESAKTVFTHNAGLMQAEAAKGKDMSPEGAQGIYQVLVQLQPWWIIAADVDGCSASLQSACEAVDKALVETFTGFSTSGDKAGCENLLQFARDLDTVTAKFNGIAAADSSLRTKMMDVTFSDVPSKLDALDVEIAKGELEVATMVMALTTMEGLVPLWGTTSSDDDGLPKRLAVTLESLEAKVVETTGSCSSAKALALMKNAVKYEQLCKDLALGEKSLQKTMAPLIAKSCLTDVEGEIGKTEGMDPSLMMKSLDVFKSTPAVKSTIGEDEEIKSRLLAALRALEDRVADGFQKSVADENMERIQNQKKFAGLFDELVSEVEADIPEDRHTLGQRLDFLLFMGAAEKQVNSGPEMDCAKVNKGLDHLTALCAPPKSAPAEMLARMQALCITLRPALFARTLRAGEERMAFILECAKKSETALAAMEKREASRTSIIGSTTSELCTSLQNTKDVNKCLAIMDDELAKESGMNPNVVLEALQALKEVWSSVASVGDFELRLVSVFALLEERMLDACNKSLEKGQFDKVTRLLNFGSRCDEVRQEADGEAKLCEQLASVVVNHHVTAAEKEMQKDSGFHPKTLLDSIGHLPELLPRLDGITTSESCLLTNDISRSQSLVSEVVERGAGPFLERLAILRRALAARMDKSLDDALRAKQPRKIQALIKFASEYDSVFAELALEVDESLSEPLQAKAESGASSVAAAKPDGEDEGGAAGTILTNGTSEGAALDAARSELLAMKKSDLQKLARSLGISEEDRDAALDADDPKEALVELVFQLQKAAIEAEQAKQREGEEAEKAKRAQLEAMKMGDLQKLARSLGVSEEDRDAALDADDPKGALIDLILPLQGVSAEEEDA